VSPEEKKSAADTQIKLGNEHEDRGAFEAALSCYLVAVKAAPDYPRAHLNLASALALVGRFDDAVDALQMSLTLDPTYAPAHYNLGKLHASRRQFDAAERELRNALRLDPSFVDAAIVLASVCDAQGHADQAEGHLRSAAAHGSGSAGAAYNLGLLLNNQNRFDEAERAFDQALALDPNLADACVGLGNLYLRTRRAREAEPLFRKALAISPRNWDAANNFLFSTNFRDDLTPLTIYREHMSVAMALESENPRHLAPGRIDNGSRKLKIGYVSGDFGHHPVALFMRPVLANHDREHFEIYCYSNNEPDLDLTRELKASSDHWRDITLQTDDQAASLIRSDAIDILVDLSGYTAGSRLPVFMRRPAPIQASWLGYLNTTGLQSIDYRISDRYADPPGSGEQFYSEQLIRLPHSQWCYRPIYEVPLPAARDDSATPIVFGCFNQFAKISDSCLALWCEILKQVPDSQLRVISVPGKSAESAFRNRVESHGVDPRRIETAGRMDIHGYFAAIGNVDVALDTFPYNGATTTLDTLWMGVPIVALPGSTAVARSSFSILSSLAAPELIATSSADLIARNVALATTADWRRTLRRSLRARMESSPLMDAPGFTRDLEEGFHRMWRDGRLK
jgi:predicted O-linked N-acetylglucosamine transferase (SPINDLY family)